MYICVYIYVHIFIFVSHVFNQTKEKKSTGKLILKNKLKSIIPKKRVINIEYMLEHIKTINSINPNKKNILFDIISRLI